MDMGSFAFPNGKAQLKVLVMVDAFSLLITGDLYPTESVTSADCPHEGGNRLLVRTSSTNTVDTSRICIERAEGNYSTAVTDLGPQFNSVMFRTVLARLGSTFEVVPREAHWANLAEKGIDVNRTQLNHILNLSQSPSDHMSPRTIFQAAVKRANNKVMSQYNLSRNSIHRGNRNIRSSEGDSDPCTHYVRLSFPMLSLRLCLTPWTRSARN